MPTFRSSTLRPARAPGAFPATRTCADPILLLRLPATIVVRGAPGASALPSLSPLLPPLPVAPGLRPAALRHPLQWRRGLSPLALCRLSLLGGRGFLWVPRVEAGAACPCPVRVRRPGRSSPRRVLGRPLCVRRLKLVRGHCRPRAFPTEVESRGLLRVPMVWRALSLDSVTVPVPTAGLLFGADRLRSQPQPPPPRSAVYQKSRRVEWKPPLVTRHGPVTRDLTPAQTRGDTLSISCERGAFLVPPLLFSFCLEENKTYLLWAASYLSGARLGKAASLASQRPPRQGRGRCSHCRGGAGRASLSALGRPRGAMGNEPFSCQQSRHPVFLRPSQLQVPWWGPAWSQLVP